MAVVLGAYSALCAACSRHSAKRTDCTFRNSEFWLDKTLAAFQCEYPFFILKGNLQCHAWREEAGGDEFNRIKRWCTISVLLQGNLFCCLFEVKRDFQWHLCAEQWSRPHVLSRLCRWGLKVFTVHLCSIAHTVSQNLRGKFMQPFDAYKEKLMFGCLIALFSFQRSSQTPWWIPSGWSKQECSLRGSMLML